VYSLIHIGVAVCMFCALLCLIIICFYLLFSGGTLLVAQLVEALRYKPEGRWFDSRWFRWNFSLT